MAALLQSEPFWARMRGKELFQIHWFVKLIIKFIKFFWVARMGRNFDDY